MLIPRLPLPMLPDGVRFALAAAVPDWRRSRNGPHAGGVEDVDRALERTIGRLLDQRRAGTTICPSEAARALDPTSWRGLMPAARAAAGRLAAAGEVEVTQRGEVVDVATARGPVRIRRASVERLPAEGSGDLA